jgi:hypothetical protein
MPLCQQFRHQLWLNAEVYHPVTFSGQKRTDYITTVHTDGWLLRGSMESLCSQNKHDNVYTQNHFVVAAGSNWYSNGGDTFSVV